MGLILLPLFLLFGLAAGSLVAALSVAALKSCRLSSKVATWAAGLAGMTLGNVLGWAIIIYGATGNASEGFYIFGFDLFGFLCIGVLVMPLLAAVLVVVRSRAGRRNLNRAIDRLP